MDFLYWLAGFRTAAGNAFFIIVTHFGDELMALAILLTVFWCVNKKAGYYMIYSTLFGLVLNQFLKAVFAIPRPWIRDPGFVPVAEAKATAGGYSFPSGHTATATAVYGSMARYTKRKELRAAGILLIVIVAFSRMYLGVHTPADVGVSLLAGTGFVLALYPVLVTYEKSDKAFFGLQAVFLLCVIGFFLFFCFRGVPQGTSLTEEELFHGAASGMKHSYQILGAGFGIAVTHWFDRCKKPFETEAVWWAQILKLVLGLALILVVKTVLKTPLSLLFQGHQAADAVRYFAVVATAGVIWPLSFPFWKTLGSRV